MKPIALTIAFAVLASSTAFAQTQSADQKFKHNKHASVVFREFKDHPLKCDLYVPESDSPRPVFLAIHGGAWTTGTKFAMIRHARIMANRGYVVMSINYRLAPDHKWPAQIHDCKHAVRWIRENAAKYNADPKQVYAFGYSAGAHLALMLATTDPDDGLEGTVDEPYKKHSSRIDGCIVGGSPSEFSWIEEDANTLAYWLGGSPAESPDQFKQASPTTWITADDPLVVMFHGSRDTLVPVSSPKTFHEKYQAAGLLSHFSVTSDGHASAFTRTTLTLNALAKFRELLVRQQGRRQEAFLRDQYESFTKANKRSPASRDELNQFITQNKTEFPHPRPHKVPSLFSDPQTGKQFAIPWGKPWANLD